jgi:threonyl-tRNA synthetase
MLIVGDREQESDQVGVREHRLGDRGSESVAGLIGRLSEQVESRSAG